MAGLLLLLLLPLPQATAEREKAISRHLGAKLAGNPDVADLQAKLLKYKGRVSTTDQRPKTCATWPCTQRRPANLRALARLQTGQHELTPPPLGSCRCGCRLQSRRSACTRPRPV